MKAPQNASRLIIDNEAASVVRMTFDLALEEKTLSAIASALTEQNVPPPLFTKPGQEILAMLLILKNQQMNK